MATLYISDLDGTLFRNDANLSEAGKVALQKLLRDGLEFSVASARSVVSMRGALQGLRLTLPVIEFNGALLSDLETGRHEVVNALEPDIAEEIFGSIVRVARSPFVCTYDGKTDCVYYGAASNEGERHYLSDRLEHDDHRFRHTRTLAEALRDQVVCLTVIGESGPLGELELALREQHGNRVEIHLFENAYSPGWYWLTIHDRRATKDQAIRRLMDTYGLAERELVVFGDQLNDIKMFKIAAQAVAVENAHPDVKRHATHVIGSNEEDSVVRYIRDHYGHEEKGS